MRPTKPVSRLWERPGRRHPAPRPGSRPARGRLTAGAAHLTVALTLAACSGSELSAELVPETSQVVLARSERVGVVLSEDDGECVARSLDDDSASQLIALDPDDGLDEMAAEGVVDGVVSCVGSFELARSSLSQFGEGASEESLGCAADRLDEGLVRRLLVSLYTETGTPPAEVELALVSALSFCLEPTELLNRGE